jgi:hypothetical protein
LVFGVQSSARVTAVSGPADPLPEPADAEEDEDEQAATAPTAAVNASMRPMRRRAVTRALVA